MDKEAPNTNILKFMWVCTICWFLLTGHSWTDFLVLGNFKIVYLSEIILFASSLCYLFTFSNNIFRFTLYAQLVEWFLLLPNTPNHRWVFAFGAVVLLLNKDPIKINKALGIIAATVYFFAGFVKVNPDFIFARHSCCLEFFGNTLLDNNLEFVEKILPAIVTIVELLLVVFILNPKTRILSVFISLCLHLGLALDMLKHFLDFSSVMSCLMLAQILPNNSLLYKDQFLKKLGRFCVLNFIFLIFARSGLFFEIKNSTFSIILEIYWLFYYAFLFITLYKISNLDFLKWRIFDKHNLNFATKFALLLIIFNGLTPYIGIKTKTSFSMYSNLWIDDQGSNHYLIPKSLDIFGFLADDVKIISTNDNGELKILKERNSTIPYLQLYNYLKREPYVKASFERSGKMLSYPEENLPSPGRLVDNWLARKFLTFQGSNKEISNQCIW